VVASATINHKKLCVYQGDQKIGKKVAQNLEKVAETVAKPKKCQNIFNKAKLESTKHLHQTNSKLLKYLQQTIFPPEICKVAQMAKFRQIWSPNLT
jgi:hypothetical protein